ncbi:glycosyltransferase family 15 protein [Mycena olivaceomarginata]|nr:glycosyltransferase family 15 protein [Mycena olivaceomarginata]
MFTKIHYTFLVLAILVGFHYLLTLSGVGYGSVLPLIPPIEQPCMPPKMVWIEPPYQAPASMPMPPQTPMPPPAPIANITTAGTRNGDLRGVKKSMAEFEEKFNRKFGYPYVFLNEEPFTEEFKQSVAALTHNEVEFGLIPHEHCAGRQQMMIDKVIYGGNVPYRNMCRYTSGYFYRHELLQKYHYYWRIEPDVRFFCTIDNDPFVLMEEQGKKYGFTIALPEYERGIKSLWDAVKEFTAANPDLVSSDNTLGFLSDDGGQSYNNCAFWSNFEIANLDFWRGEAYTKFFDHLDAKGGFYYERWCSNNVHSIAAALLARKDEIHFFDNIGYRHEPFQHCKCECDMIDNFDFEGWSCLPRYQCLFG